MDRENLLPIFRRWPKWALVVLFLLVGLPCHLVAGMWIGFFDGLNAFKHEWKMFGYLDKEQTKGG